MKRIFKSGLSIFLAVTIIFSSAYVGFSEIDFGRLFEVDAKATSEDFFDFSTTSNGTAYTVSGWNENWESGSWSVTIPSTYNGKPVVSIRARAFYNCTFLSSITIPSSVELIGQYTFAYCSNLKTVTFEEGLETIGRNAFEGCTSLKSINIPSSVTSMDFCVFMNCINLESVTIGSNINEIGENTFYGCKNLSVITIPSSVTQIKSAAFKGCDNLKAVYITDLIAWCNIYFGYDTTYSQTLTSNPLSFADELYINDELVTDITIPNTGLIDMTLKSYAFYDFDGLISVTIPDNLQTIGSQAFYSCDELKYVFYGSDSISWNNIIGLSGSGLINAKVHYNSTGHMYETDWVLESGPTCSVEGKKYRVCSACGDNIYELLPMIEHNASDWIIVTESTCLANGSKQQICTECDVLLTEEVIPKKKHVYSEEWSIDKDCSCTEVGFKSHHCINCDKKLDVTEIPASGHNYGDFVVTAKPNCTEEGSKSKTCSVCGDVVTELISANGHKYSEEWTIDKEATCTTAGSKSHHCVNCDDKTDVTVIQSFGHRENVTIIEPTCTEQGYTTHTCSICGNSYIDSYTDALGHNYGDWIITKEPTCTEEGLKSKTCSACGDVVNENISVLGHKHGDWGITKSPTCTEEGIKITTCLTCGDEITEVVEALGHTASDEWIIDKEPTCSIKGSKHKDCTICGETVETGTIPTTEHNYGKWIVDESATCISSGMKHKECEICGDWFVGIIPVMGHISSTEWTIDIAPTCTEEGSKSHRCINCDTKTDITKIPAIGHRYGDWFIISEPTCINIGSKYRECAKCKYIETASIPTVAHTGATEWNVELEPTCTENGLEDRECSWCGTIVETKIIEATGHTASSWYTDKNATVYNSGSKHKECIDCGEVLETATIKQLNCSKPKLKTIANTEYGVKITWSKVSGADKYRVYRKTSKSDWEYIGTTSKTYYTDKTAKSGTKYFYAVKSRNEAGNSSLSSSLSKYYLADPTLKTPSSTKSGVSLKWTKSAGAQGYIIYRKTGSGSYTKLKTEKGVSNLSYVDKSAKKGKKYTYKVKAYYSKTYSAYSNTKTITDKY